MEELSAQHVMIDDFYWSRQLETNSSQAIYHQWEQLVASGCIENFRIVHGEVAGLREGWFFADSDAYKWLDAAARIYSTHPDQKLARLMDELIVLIGHAQASDGYLFTFNQIHFPGIRWKNLMIEHELYCHGHLIEAGVSHYQATNQTSLLEIARKAANRVTADFQGKGPDYTPGHEEIEIALLRLYQVSGDQSYLEMARQFLEQRGRKSQPGFLFSMIHQIRSASSRLAQVRKERGKYLAEHPEYPPKKVPPGNYSKTVFGSYLRWLGSDLSGKYLQQHAPIRQQTVPVGHSVRFGYLETAMAMLERIQGDSSMLPAMEKTWQHMVERRMYITGGIGAVPGLEGFGNDYELDPEYAYAETCAALACLFWNWQLGLITGRARYSDLFEWQLYNAAAVGMGLSGQNYLYNNPLACRGGITRRAWYSVPCCPSNLSRTWADLGKYIYSLDKSNIWIHQYIGNRIKVQLGSQVDLQIESSLPWDGNIRIRVEPSTPTEFTLHLRIPSWAPREKVSQMIKVNNAPTQATNHSDVELIRSELPDTQGYHPEISYFLPIQRVWSAGDIVQLTLDMPICLRQAHPKIKNHKGKVAVTRGPLVYCLESTDNPGVDIFSARLNTTSLVPENAPHLLGGITTLKGTAINGQPLTFIPYHLWANRGESQMTVWVNI
jgi:DUF1680 family protein